MNYNGGNPMAGAMGQGGMPQNQTGATLPAGMQGTMQQMQPQQGQQQQSPISALQQAMAGAGQGQSVAGTGQQLSQQLGQQAPQIDLEGMWQQFSQTLNQLRGSANDYDKNLANHPAIQSLFQNIIGNAGQQNQGISGQSQQFPQQGSPEKPESSGALDQSPSQSPAKNADMERQVYKGGDMSSIFSGTSVGH